MKDDFAVLFMFVLFGSLTKRLGWKAWLGVAAFVFLWLMYSWLFDTKK